MCGSLDPWIGYGLDGRATEEQIEAAAYKVTGQTAAPDAGDKSPMGVGLSMRIVDEG